MLPSSAVGAALMGGCLFALAAGRRRVALTLALLLTFGAGRALFDLLVGRLHWLDAWAAARGFPVPPIDAGRVTANGALAFLLGGGALLVAASGSRLRWLLPLIVGLMTAFVVLPLLNGLVAVSMAGAASDLRGIPWPTGLLILLLAGALLRGSPFDAGPAETAARSMLSAAFGLLLATGWISLQSGWELSRRNQRVLHSHEVNEGIGRFTTEIAAMEASARGYGLTGREDFRGRFRVHRAEVEQALDALRRLTADDPGQRERAGRIAAVAGQHLIEVAALVQARASGGLAASAEVVARRTPAAAVLLPELTDEMGRVERGRLQQFERLRSSVEREARAMEGFGSLLAVVLVGIAVIQTRGSAAARQRAEESLRANQAQLEQRVADRTRELELANAHLRESERSLRFLADAMPQMVWTHQPEGPVDTVNREWREYTGLNEAQSMGRGWEQVLHPEDAAPTLELWDGLMAAGREGGGELRLRRASDGAWRWMLWRVRPERDSAGRIVRWVSTATDIQEDKAQRALLEQRVRERTAELAASEASLAQARDAALAASQLKSEFLANVSHEIRTPMNGIIGMSGVLMETELSPEQHEMGRVIQQSSEALLAIINDILDFSKIEAGKLQIETAEFDLRNVVGDILRLLEPRAVQKGVELRVEFDAALDGGLMGDAGRVRQVLINLVGNAVKFTDQGEVTVRLIRTGAVADLLSLRAEIIDTGVGIPIQSQAQLFQPFTQADGTTTRRYGGTGLGLAISRQLIELMGGAIGFESEPGRGSRFWFTLSLPCRRTIASPVAPASRSGAGAGAGTAATAAGSEADADAAAGADAGGPSQAGNRPAADADAGARVAAGTAGWGPARNPGVGGAPPAGPSPLRLLVAEDNPVNQVVARQLLEKMGHAVAIAADGLATLAELARGSYDAVLMDCQMPELDGYATTRRIRSGQEPGIDPRIPIIALTAYAMADDRAKCIEAGMDDYISKPVRPADLTAAFVRCGLINRSGAA